MESKYIYTEPDLIHLRIWAEKSLGPSKKNVR